MATREIPSKTRIESVAHISELRKNRVEFVVIVRCVVCCYQLFLPLFAECYLEWGTVKRQLTQHGPM